MRGLEEEGMKKGKDYFGKDYPERCEVCAFWNRVNKTEGTCSRNPNIWTMHSKRGWCQPQDGCMGFLSEARKKLQDEKKTSKKEEVVSTKIFRCFLCKEVYKVGDQATDLVLNPLFEAVCKTCYEQWEIGRDICKKVEKKCKKKKANTL